MLPASKKFVSGANTMAMIEYRVEDKVAIVTLNRPGQHNAQNAALLKELDETFDKAVADDQVRVIVLNANGKHFSSGHDISMDVFNSEPWQTMFDKKDQEGLLRLYRWELKHYYGYSKKWRDLPKPTIASVQGACIAAGLMLAWPCDIIIAADNARFSDPVIHMGIGGVEYHAHTWEFGPRKAKELLFTGGSIRADEAHRLGMVNRVVPLDELQSETMALANEIAQKHPHGVLMAKQAVNQTMDAQGFNTSLQNSYNLHHLGHANAWVMEEQIVLAGLNEMTEANRKKDK
jgi:enoyl-CoA hydratase